MKKNNLGYTKKVIEYFLKQKYVGEIKNADGIGKLGNPICGDVMQIYIKVGKKNGKEYIKDIKFKTLGCVAAIASSSALCELVKGKSLKDALKISRKDIIKKVGNLPPIKYHCSILGEETLFEAIYDYMKKTKKKIPKEIEEKHRKISKYAKK